MNKVVINYCYGGFALSEEACEYLLEKYGMDLRKDPFPLRHDERLIDCVETLGEKANGDYSELAVVEIEGDRYRIVEYDGCESVETPQTIKWTLI